MKWVSFYKRHRDVLDNGDIIHLRRPSGRDWDGILHANPGGREKGMACLYNPLERPISGDFRLPLAPTGLKGHARAAVDEGPAAAVPLDATRHATLRLTLPARGRTFVVFTKD